jgi:hypothetical protein
LLLGGLRRLLPGRLLPGLLGVLGAGPAPVLLLGRGLRLLRVRRLLGGLRCLLLGAGLGRVGLRRLLLGRGLLLGRVRLLLGRVGLRLGLLLGRGLRLLRVGRLLGGLRCLLLGAGLGRVGLLLGPVLGRDDLGRRVLRGLVQGRLLRLLGRPGLTRLRLGGRLRGRVGLGGPGRAGLGCLRGR